MSDWIARHGMNRLNDDLNSVNEKISLIQDIISTKELYGFLNNTPTEDAILEKAKVILAEEERKYFIIKANLCPECGNKLEKYNKKNSDYGRKCSIDETHFSIIDGYHEEY